MDLFVVRHGEASFYAKSDRLRPLTDLGKRETAACLALAKDSLSSVQQIWVSDLDRAQQTAQILNEVLNVEVLTKTILRPEGDPNLVIRTLESEARGTVLIVAHQPLLGDLVSLLLEGHMYAGHPFTTSEILRLEGEVFEAGLWRLGEQFLPR